MGYASVTGSAILWERFIAILQREERGDLGSRLSCQSVTRSKDTWACLCRLAGPVSLSQFCTMESKSLYLHPEHYLLFLLWEMIFPFHSRSLLNSRVHYLKWANPWRKQTCSQTKSHTCRRILFGSFSRSFFSYPSIGLSMGIRSGGRRSQLMLKKSYERSLKR